MLTAFYHYILWYFIHITLTFSLFHYWLLLIIFSLLHTLHLRFIAIACHWRIELTHITPVIHFFLNSFQIIFSLFISFHFAITPFSPHWGLSLFAFRILSFSLLIIYHYSLHLPLFSLLIFSLPLHFTLASLLLDTFSSID